MDAAAALEDEALRENHLDGFKRNWVMPEDGEDARGETGGGRAAEGHTMRHGEGSLESSENGTSARVVVGATGPQNRSPFHPA